MTRKEVINWLLSIRELNGLKRSYIRELERICVEMESLRDIKSSALDPSNVSTNRTGTSDPTADRAIKVVTKYTDMINAIQDKLIDIADEISTIRLELEVIFKVTKMNANHYTVITFYYFEGMSNDEISTATDYSVSWVKSIKNDAIRIITDYKVD